jgi:hypothetical protein
LSERSFVSEDTQAGSVRWKWAHDFQNDLRDQNIKLFEMLSCTIVDICNAPRHEVAIVFYKGRDL